MGIEAGEDLPKNIRRRLVITLPMPTIHVGLRLWRCIVPGVDHVPSRLGDGTKVIINATCASKAGSATSGCRTLDAVLIIVHARHASRC